MEFTGKTVFITGGASGIGRATALAFAARGANVAIVTKRSEAKAKQTVQQIEALGGRGIYILADITKEEDVIRAVQTTVEAFGGLDIAFNNAGVGPDGVTIPLCELTDVTQQDWDRVSDTCLKGSFLCIKHELKQMQTQEGDRVILTTASTAGMKPMGSFGAYGPAKAGLICLTKEAAVENRDRGIRCNVICPGPTAGTGMSERMFGKAPEGEVPLGPGGLPMNKPEDVAQVVLWLCSESGRRINGNVITIDGGMDIL